MQVRYVHEVQLIYFVWNSILLDVNWQSWLWFCMSCDVMTYLTTLVSTNIKMRNAMYTVGSIDGIDW